MVSSQSAPLAMTTEGHDQQSARCNTLANCVAPLVPKFMLQAYKTGKMGISKSDVIMSEPIGLPVKSPRFTSAGPDGVNNLNATALPLLP
jgi:hypothetical protein